MFKYDDYPESCPPINAVELNGQYFRLCKEIVPAACDFVTHVEQGLYFPPAKRCEAMALSFFCSAEQADKMKKKFKRKFTGYSVVPVEIQNEFGRGIVKNGHLNLWEYRDVNIYETIKEDNAGVGSNEKN